MTAEEMFKLRLNYRICPRCEMYFDFSYLPKDEFEYEDGRIKNVCRCPQDGEQKILNITSVMFESGWK